MPMETSTSGGIPLSFGDWTEELPRTSNRILAKRRRKPVRIEKWSKLVYSEQIYKLTEVGPK